MMATFGAILKEESVHGCGWKRLVQEKAGKGERGRERIDKEKGEKERDGEGTGGGGKSE